MQMSTPRRSFGFHDGELAVQRQAAVTAAAARLEGMLAQAELSQGVASFLAGRTFSAMTARDHQGRLWTSPLVGAAGFLEVLDPTSLSVGAAPGPGDPLHRLDAGQSVGLIVIDYARRRRFRLNGVLTATSANRLTVTVEEAFGNCPQFIPQREISPLESSAAPQGIARGVPSRNTWSAADRATIAAADTFILGSTHVDHGNDASHRGGPPGFVRVEGQSLWWPDYPGNNLFSSLGNVALDPEVSLLFPDFGTRTALYLNGLATVGAVEVGSDGDDAGTGRRVTVTPRAIVRGRLPVASTSVNAYPANPPLRRVTSQGVAR